MRADELIELFGDTVTQLTGNPYTGRELTAEQIENIFLAMQGRVFLAGQEKASESDPAR